MIRPPFVVTLGLLLAALLLASTSVKVIAIDHDAARVTFLLPMHYASITASRFGSGEIELKTGEYYRAELLAGAIHTTRRNRLRVFLGDKRHETYRILSIRFLKE